MGIIKNILHQCDTIKDSRTIIRPMLKLTEEVGELATEVNIKLGNLEPSKGGSDGVIGEGSDIIIAALDIMFQENKNITEEDITKIINEKLLKWKSSYN